MGDDVDYISSKEAAAKWNVSIRWVQYLCNKGVIEGAFQLNGNGVWLIPKDSCYYRTKRSERQIIKK